jgi:predicted AlkP superfamily phosphohydrolase/phosphomutase
MKTILLGFDAFDPRFFESLYERGLLPNLGKYVSKKGYAHFTVANPPQSEVSWTSIATGHDPGWHGIFDFVHRDPKTYTFYVSLLPTRKKLGAIQFVPPTTARTIFEHATHKGFQATSLWWPATFPARLESTVNTLPGLGTPDIQGKLGVGAFFTSERDFKADEWKTSIEILSADGKDLFKGTIKGPEIKKQDKVAASTSPLVLERLDDQHARIIIGKHNSEMIRLDLALGKWSPVIELTFHISLLIKVRAITRLIVTQLSPHIRLYALPMQIHPLHSPWQYAAPPGFAKRTWNTCGPFLTLGWPQDTTGLEDGCITDDQFLDLCNSIFNKRQEILFHQLRDFKEGLLASVFDSLDRVQHMFWRDRPDVIQKWYVWLDELVGKVEQGINGKSYDARIVIASDHGFNRFDYKVHLNRWLIDNGYTAIKGKADLQAQTENLDQVFTQTHKGNFQDIDWTRSRAYALGLNSLYMNLAGREGQGIVQREEIEPLLTRLKNDLLAWQGPDGKPVVNTVYYRHEVFSGPLVEYAPDLVIGYAPGYRASGETGVGSWKSTPIEPNQDHWKSDHCIDPQSVPGVIFSNQGLVNYPSPSFRDVPMITIDEDFAGSGKPVLPSTSEEDQKTLEERLKGLGYL